MAKVKCRMLLATNLVYLRICPVSIISNITDKVFATNAPPAIDVTLAIADPVIPALSCDAMPHTIAAAIKCKSATKLAAKTVDPKRVRSPNFIIVHMMLATKAANNS